MIRRPLLPVRVVLPTRPALSPGDLYRATGISKATAYNWRRKYAFPVAVKPGVINIADVAAWYVRFGVKVDWN